MLEARNLSVWYQERRVLRNISLSVRPGELLTVIGSNGSGKSTLLRTLAGLHPHWDGSLTLNGNSLRNLSPKEIALHIAWLPQSRPVPDITVCRLALHGRFPHTGYPRHIRDEDRRIAWKALEDADAASLSGRFLRDLSGGERQKAYLAMALAQECDIILMDEPTAWLDIAHQFHTLALAKRLAAEGKTVVMALHDLPLAFRFADRIAVLREGELMCVSDPETIYANKIVPELFGVSFLRVKDGFQWRYYCAEVADKKSDGETKTK